MKKIKSIINLYQLPILFSWFAMTLFVDILAVPTVFRNVRSVEEAGKVGMTIFTNFNHLEFLFALVVVFGSWSIYEKYRRKIILVISFILLVWSISYNVYFTPQIIYFTKMLHGTPLTDPMLAVYQTQHAFFHKLYRYLDSTKLVMILAMLFIITRIKLTEEK